MSDEVIGGYRLLKHLATGQASQVWEVRDAGGRHFAMKLLLPENVTRGEARHFLLHEAEVGQELAHANIIRIVTVGRDPKNPYFVMEFFPAGNLKLRIQHKETAFIREKSQDMLKQMATGLAFMNAMGWLHRDIKPDNVLANSLGEVKLIDFAIAQRIPKGWARWFRTRGKPQGTRSYMSPEQIRGLALDERADIYSFAATAYELVTGRPPFRAGSNQELLAKHIVEKAVSPVVHNPDVTKEFGDLLLQMLAKKKEDRPRDFHEVLIKMRNLKVFKPKESKPR